MIRSSLEVAGGDVVDRGRFGVGAESSLQVRVVRQILRRIKGLGPTLAASSGKIVQRANIVVRRGRDLRVEGGDKVAIGSDVFQTVEGDCAPLEASGDDVVIGSRVIVGTESAYEITVGCDVLESIKLMVRPSKRPAPI